MSEVHDFSFIDPQDEKYLDYLDRMFERLPFEPNRVSYLKAVIGRERAVTMYIDNPVPGRAFQLAEQNDVVLSYFLYYTDSLFSTSADQEIRVKYLKEAFTHADYSQEALNLEETGKPILYEPTELETKIREILLADSDEKAKNDVFEMFQNDIHDIVQRIVKL